MGRKQHTSWAIWLKRLHAAAERVGVWLSVLDKPRWAGTLIAVSMLFPVLAKLYQRRFRRARTNGVNLVFAVAPFAVEPDQYRWGAKILAALEQLKEPGLEVRTVECPITVMEGREEARARARAIGAHILVWGHYGVTAEAADVTVFIEVLSTKRSMRLLEHRKDGTVPVREVTTFRLQTRLSAECRNIASAALGLAHYERGSFHEAIAQLSLVIDSLTLTRDQLAALYLGRANAHAGLGELAEATRDYTRAIECSPNFKSAYLSRGGMRAAQGDVQKALADFNAALTASSCDYDSVLFDHVDAVSFYNRGCVLLQRGRLREALADLDKSIALDPAHASAYVNRGVCHLGLGNAAGAVLDYNAALKRDPYDFRTYTNRGNAYRRQGEIALAYRDYDKAIALGQDVLAYLNRACLHAHLDEPVKAVKDIDRAIRLDSENYSAYMLRGQLLADYNLAQAITDFTRAINIEPHNFHGYAHRAVGYRMQGDSARAAADERQARIFGGPRWRRRRKSERSASGASTEHLVLSPDLFR